MSDDVVLMRGPFGDVVIGIPGWLRPLDTVLEDCRRYPPLLDEAIEHAREPGQDWGSGGDAGWMEISGERVTISEQFTDAEVALPREQFLEILLDFQRQLATFDPDAG